MKINKIVFYLCFLLIGCALKPTTPEVAMHAFFNAFKAVDFTKMNELASETLEDKIQDDYLTFIDWTTTSKTKTEVYTILKDVDVTWIREYEDDQNATFYTTIKYYNLTELKENYLEYFIKAFEIHKEPHAYDTEIAKAYKTAYLHSVPSLEKSIRITLQKQDSSWYINAATSVLTELVKPIINQAYAIDN